MTIATGYRPSARRHALPRGRRSERERETAWREMSDEGCYEGAPRNISDVTTLRICMSGAWYFKSLCERVCTVASNINGHVVAGEASLSQFLLGEEDRGESSFHCDNY